MKATADFCIKNSTGEKLLDIKNITGEEKLLDIKFDTKLLFKNHIYSSCTKARQKLHILAQIVNYVVIEKDR